MRSWQVHELGDPIDRLVLDEVEAPEAGPGRVVLDLEAVGLAARMEALKTVLSAMPEPAAAG